ncbi:hypothetical protein BaRGS_00030006, partial [Batillaria attramentaria]
DSLLQDEPGQNGWAIHNGQRFSTPDVDNDKNDYENCAAIYRAGWWYNSCMLSLLTGSYGWDKENYWMSYFFWWTWHRDFLPLKEADMKLRPCARPNRQTLHNGLEADGSRPKAQCKLESESNRNQSVLAPFIHSLPVWLTAYLVGWALAPDKWSVVFTPGNPPHAHNV